MESRYQEIRFLNFFKNSDYPISGKMEKKGTISSLVCDIDYLQYLKPQALSRVTYGLTALKINSKGKAENCRFYLHEYVTGVLKWVEIKKRSKWYKIRLSTLHKIERFGITKAFEKYKSAFDPNASVSLTFDQKTLNLIFANEVEMMQWLSGIIYLLEEVNCPINCRSTQQKITLGLWGASDKDCSGCLTIDEVKDLTRNMNLYINNEQILSLFNQFDKNKNMKIEKDEFNEMIETLMQRPELDLIFMQYSEGGNYMTKEQFERFVHEVQGVNDKSYLFEILAEEVNGQSVVSTKAFCNYITNTTLNSAVNPQHQIVSMDMTHPLPHYFISSSHNTYLEGNQLTGVSSVNQYSKVLLEGCRCIEIDTWNGDGEPVVTHGHTFVNKIPFRDVLEEVKKSAFISSTYPVIFSIENHCNYKQTGLLGEIFLQVLGDSICLPSDSLLSPDKLQYKFLIKGKVTKNSKTPGKPEKSGNPAFSNLVALVSSQFSLTHECSNIVSFKETKLKKIVKMHSCGEIIQYHSRNLSRIYPKGGRVKSSNYNPMGFWIYGAQIAAINYQTSDLGNLVNNSWFLGNGKCGYVLKPSFMRDSSVLFDVNGPSLKAPSVILHFEVISAFNLPKIEGDLDIISPSVEVSLIGIPNDHDERTTEVVNRNGFNPIWNHKFAFGVSLIEMCVVVIKVHSKGSIVAQSALPLYYIRQGIRAIQMLDSKLQTLPNSLLICRIKIEPRE